MHLERFVRHSAISSRRVNTEIIGFLQHMGFFESDRGVNARYFDCVDVRAPTISTVFYTSARQSASSSADVNIGWIRGRSPISRMCL